MRLRVWIDVGDHRRGGDLAGGGGRLATRPGRCPARSWTPAAACCPGSRCSRPASTGGSRSAVSGASGEWTVASLPVGRYSISFELSGFKKLTRGDVLVEAVVTRRVNVTLEVGALTDQVTVNADA